MKVNLKLREVSPRSVRCYLPFEAYKLVCIPGFENLPSFFAWYDFLPWFIDDNLHTFTSPSLLETEFRNGVAVATLILCETDSVLTVSHRHHTADESTAWPKSQPLLTSSSENGRTMRLKLDRNRAGDRQPDTQTDTRRQVVE